MENPAINTTSSKPKASIDAGEENITVQTVPDELITTTKEMSKSPHFGEEDTVECMGDTAALRLNDVPTQTQPLTEQTMHVEEEREVNIPPSDQIAVEGDIVNMEREKEMMSILSFEEFNTALDIDDMEEEAEDSPSSQKIPDVHNIRDNSLEPPKSPDEVLLEETVDDRTPTPPKLRDDPATRTVAETSSTTPPPYPDEPLSESVSESEAEETAVGEIKAYNLQNLGQIKLTKGPQKDCGIHNIHFCSSCLNKIIPQSVYKSMEEYSGINPSQARKAAYTLVQFLKTPQGDAIFNKISPKEEKVNIVPIIPKKKLTKDEKVCVLLRHLTRHKGVWAVFEDDSIVLPLLSRLNMLLENMDTKLFKSALKKDLDTSVLNLVIYFINEKRWSVRSEILGCFDLLASRDACALSVLLESDLPIHMTFEIQNVERLCTDSNDCKCEEKLTLYSGILTTLLCAGVGKIPSTHMDFLDTDFVIFLLGKIEDYRENHPLSSVYLKLILAMNVQFSSSEVFENPVISALSIMPKLKMFKYKLISSLTDQEDSLAAYKLEIHPFSHSSMKLLEDMMCSVHTTDVFKDDEISFIFETLVEHLGDLDERYRNPLRHSILRNLRVLLCKLKYEHPQLLALIRILRRIMREKTSASKDKKCVQKIVNAMRIYRLCTDVNTKFTAL